MASGTERFALLAATRLRSAVVTPPRTPFLTPAEGLSVPQRAGFALLCCFIFHTSSRVFDLYLAGWRLPLIISLGSLLCLLMTSKALAGMSTNIGRALIAYSIFLGLSIPFSVWRGGSFHIVVNEWTKSFMAFVIVSGLVNTAGQSAKAIQVQALGFLVAAILALLKGVETLGRLRMPDGFYAGTNELASAMVLGCLYWWFNVYKPKTSMLWKMVAIAGVLPVAVVLLRTGSRAAFISILFILPFIMFRLRLVGRIAIASTAAIAALGGALLLPPEIRDRFFTFFRAIGEVTTPEEANVLSAATASTRQRLALLSTSIVLTLKNPLFGVGAGNFEVAENNVAMSAGLLKGSWHGTHNTYTQISSECGIPALIAFVACLWFARKDLVGIDREYRARSDLDSMEIAATAGLLKIALYAMCVFFLFEHIGYAPTTPVFLGIIVGFVAAVRRNASEGLASPAPPHSGLKNRFQTASKV